MKKYWIFTISYYYLLQAVAGNGTLHIQLVKYHNPTHSKADGACCVPEENSCKKSCVNTMNFRVMSPHLQNCELNVNSVFDDDADLQMYKATCPFQQWKDNFTVDAAVEHSSTLRYFVGNFKVSMDAVNLSTHNSIKINENGEEKIKFLSFNMRISCHSGYLPPDCAIKSCIPSDDKYGHYSCGNKNEKICLEGWKDPSTDCTKAVSESSHSTVTSNATQFAASFVRIQTSFRSLEYTTNIESHRNEFTTPSVVATPLTLGTIATTSSEKVFATHTIQNGIINHPPRKEFTTHEVKNVFTTRLSQKIFTSHAIQNVTTTHLSEKVFATHVIQNGITIHPPRKEFTTHEVENLFTTRLSQKIFTSHAIQNVTTTHLSEIVFATHAIQNRITTHPPREEFTTHEVKNVFATRLSQKFITSHAIQNKKGVDEYSHSAWKLIMGASFGVLFALVLFTLLFLRKRCVQKFRVHTLQNGEEQIQMKEIQRYYTEYK